MEYIIEFILELTLESSIEASKNSRIPAWIRYLLITLITLFFAFVIGIVFYAGIIILDKNLFGGLFIIAIGIFMSVSGIVKFKNAYLRVQKR